MIISLSWAGFTLGVKWREMITMKKIEMKIDEKSVKRNESTHATQKRIFFRNMFTVQFTIFKLSLDMLDQWTNKMRKQYQL